MYQTILVKIITREGTVFEQNVKSLTSFNRTGKFDILPTHSNFISLIEKEIIVNKESGSKQRFTFFSGLLQVLDNKVNIYLGFRK